MKTYTERLRDLREDRDLRQEDIAKKLGLKQRTYSNYEMGETEPRIKTLIDLSEYYEVSTDYLLGRTDESKPYPPPKN